MKGKRGREEAENDRMSNLPDFVLLHIMRFMNTKQAVQTCVLSTRWKDLWRQLTNLALNNSDFTNTLSKYSQFVFSFLSHRDNSISLHDIILSNITHLNLSFWSVPGRRIQLPSSMQLPALKGLHLGYVTFAANDEGIVDPF
jgi:hypothetical protein